MYDVLIIGGGPAGLSAALILGRCGRSVIIADSGKPRNLPSQEMHGYLTRDGINPSDFLDLGYEDIKRYGVRNEDMEAGMVNIREGYFEIEIAGGGLITARKVLIATGIRDILPEITGISEYYGKSVFHCPYCDGWENRNRAMAVYAKGKAAYALSFSMLTWSRDIFLFTDGNARLTETEQHDLVQQGIKIRTQKIKRLNGEGGILKSIELENGEIIEREVIFFSTGQRQHSDIAVKLGCSFDRKGFIRTNKKQQTNIPGVYAAGDVTKDMKFVIVAAAEGARAGAAINMELQEEERLKALNK